jgi:hypothetical protein
MVTRHALPERPVVETTQPIQLLVAAKERGRRALVRLHPRMAPGRDGVPDAKWLRLALDADRIQLLVVEQRLRRPPGWFPNDHATGGRGRLQPRCGIHHITHHTLSVMGGGGQDDGGLTGHNPDPDREIQPWRCCIQFGDGVEHA